MVNRSYVAGPGTTWKLSSGWALLIPCAFALGAAAPALIPAFKAHKVLLPTFLGAGGALLAWAAWLYIAGSSKSRILELQVSVKKPHWIQAGAQSALLLYWGWHVPPVFANLPFLFSQLFFAYGLDALLQWTRRGRYGYYCRCSVFSRMGFCFTNIARGSIKACRRLDGSQQG